MLARILRDFIQGFPGGRGRQKKRLTLHILQVSKQAIQLLDVLGLSWSKAGRGDRCGLGGCCFHFEFLLNTLQGL